MKLNIFLLIFSGVAILLLIDYVNLWIIFAFSFCWFLVFVLTSIGLYYELQHRCKKKGWQLKNKQH